VPGRVGRVLGLGIGLVFRFLPVLRRDLLAIRDAMAARLGDERPVTDRIRLLTISGLSRVFGRSDRLALALQARCLSWNPTLPELRFTRRDVGPLLLGSGLLLASIIPLLPGY
jgi:biotin transport system permease protein